VADYLLDSDVIIWFLRGRTEAVDLVKNLSGRGVLGCSALSIIEVLGGVKPKDEPSTEAFLDTLRSYPVDRSTARQAAGLIRQHRIKGRTLQFVDATIAATCLAHDLTLVTYNQRHFPMSGLRMLP